MAQLGMLKHYAMLVINAINGAVLDLESLKI